MAGHRWGWGAAATGGIVGSYYGVGFYDGGYHPPYGHGDAGYPLYDDDCGW